MCCLGFAGTHDSDVQELRSLLVIRTNYLFICAARHWDARDANKGRRGCQGNVQRVEADMLIMDFV